MATLAFGQANLDGLNAITNAFIKQISQATNDGKNARNAVAAVQSLATNDIAFDRFLPLGLNSNLLNGISLINDPVTQVNNATTILLNAATASRGNILTAIKSLSNLAAQL